ncbi:RNA polymerase subunit RPO22 [White-tailed deer poxvirus]|uniref:DNA-directed RNA polymerase subunit n=1 Tax=Deerpox virus (strain Mule deer/United States/W-848-83/1983) TaxID=305674 RepID=Q08FS4_DPV83|nr:RNA polymerase subunit RPO22 [Deerpox virus W-848-83]ABI99233.1 RNA polymerase subunit RPO22 [Deerpox virus W-848-83]AUI80639.1 RNA polymerase subunit RPO22 [White-tailed deer poxvirus]
MNQHNVKYLAKILCLKTEVLRNPYAIISKDILSKYYTEIKYDDLITIITVIHKIDSEKVVFQVFNESSVLYNPVEKDYGYPIIITSFLQMGHNKFPAHFLYIDIVASDLFPKFVRLTPDEINIVNSVLQIGDSKDSLKLPKMLETEISAKILFHKDYPLKIIRFFRNNMVTGLEISDRVLITVLE